MPSFGASGPRLLVRDLVSVAGKTSRGSHENQRTLGVIAAVLLVSRVASGQSIAGTVVDESGAVLPGVAVDRNATEVLGPRVVSAQLDF